MKTRTFRQAQTTECPIAALGVLLDHFGRYVPLEELRERAGISRDCASAGDLLRVGRELGLSGRALKAELGDFDRIGFPLIAHVRFIHFVVVERVEDSLVYLNDPAVGRHAIRVEQFDEAFTGIALSFRPSPEFATGGSPPSLGLEALRALRPAWGAAASAAFVAFLLAGLPVAAALFLERGVDALARANAPLPVALLGLGGLLLALAFVRERLLQAVAGRLSRQHTRGLFSHLFGLPFAFFTYRFPADLAATLRLPIELSGHGTGRLGRSLLGALALVPLVLALGYYDLVSAIGVTSVVALHLVLTRTLLRSPSWRYERLLLTSGRALPASKAVLERAKTGGISAEVQCETASRHAQGASLAQDSSGRRAIEAVASGLAASLALLAVLGLGGLALVEGRISLGGLLALGFLAIVATAIGRELASDEGELETLETGAASLGDLANLKPELRAQDPETPERVVGPLRLVDVSFGYSVHKPARISEASLELLPGDSLGITGPSGGGKSTLAALLVGLHEPWSGRVELAGRPLSEFPRSVLARSLAWVHRTPLLFGGTLRENLTLFDPSVSEEALQAAVADALLEEVVGARPDGLEARISAKGPELSAGERQRVELARALVYDPPILVLDEALDALQPELEARIRENLKRRGVTLVVVSHRASTLAACQRVVVVERGRLVPFSEPTAPEETESRSLESSPVDDRAEPLAIEPSPAAEPRSEPASPKGPFHGGHPAPGPRLVPQSGALLARTLVLVAEAGGLDETLCEAETVEDGHAGIQAWARQSGLWARRIQLVRQDWWRRESEPLLVFSAEGAPLAVLPSHRGVFLVDPRDESRRELTGEAAGSLARSAYVFYRREPEATSDLGGFLRQVVRRAGGDFWPVAILSALAALLLALVPLGTVLLLGEALPFGDLRLAAAALGALALATVGAALLAGASQIFLRRWEARVEHQAFAAATDRLVRLEPAALQGLGPDELPRFSRGLAGAAEKLAGARGGLLALPVALASWGVLAFLSAPLALAVGVLLAALPLAAVLLALRGRTAEAVRADEARENSLFLTTLLEGMPRLRSAGADRRVAARWEEGLDRELSAAQQARRPEGLYQALEEAHPLLCVGGFLTVAAAGWAGSLEPALLAGAMVALFQCLAPVAVLARGLRAGVQAREELLRFAPLLELPIETGVGRAEPGVLGGELEARELSFAHGGTPEHALHEVSLRLAAGEVVALAGPSGAGKTTLLRLLAGLHEPRRGQVLYDARPLGELDLEVVRAQLGTVLQGDELQSSTLRYSVAGTSPNGLDKVWDALRAAGLEEDVARMPMGIQTILEDERVSSGEKQRLLLASRLVRNPRVLLLDEVTSAVSEEAEAAIFAAIRARGITCLFAAHRESGVKLADRVCVLDKGRIVESGPPVDLLARRESTLAKLFAREPGRGAE